ncbi:hypothetical protein [Desulfosarcina sp. BuS5]|uniref:hypothetical protein n=1 Tax=Desulfosarcina sp. BuS5 TaxID=933262 RepID=UPI0012F90BA9|nr:hypothetical protein [Desulfosarcina sp. BuS5]
MPDRPHHSLTLAHNPSCTDIMRKILILNNNGGNDVETRHALSLQLNRLDIPNPCMLRYPEPLNMNSKN